MTTKKNKSLHEDFARFFENPTRDKFRELIKTNYGELDNLDFKQEWTSIWSKTAKHILGIANNGGGCLIVGVKQLEDKSLEPCGLSTLVDKADIIKKIKKYLPSFLLSEIEVLDFSFDASEYPKLVGKTFQILLIGDNPKYLPFVSQATSGNDIRETAIYVRRGTSTEEANYEELQRILNRRIETNQSSQTELDLQTHFDQLNFLYSLIKEGKVVPNSFLKTLGAFGEVMVNLASNFEVVPNSLYPKESIEEFTSKLIQKKKRKIEFELGVADITDKK
jgi:hypothetical protein